MKKLVSLLLSLTLVLAMTGCGKEQSATYVMTSVQEGITMTDTQVVEAKGDVVKSLYETTTLDLSESDSEMVDFLVAYYDEAFGSMKDSAPASVVVEYGLDGTTYTAIININLDGADLQELINGGYINVTSDNANTLKYISFSQTCAALEASGYTLQ